MGNAYGWTSGLKLLGALLLTGCAGGQAPEPAPLPPPRPAASALPVGPGVVVPDADEEARCRTLLDAVIAGRPNDALPYLGEALMLGPAAWTIARQDAPNLGKKVTFVLPDGEGEARLPGRLVGDTDLPKLLRGKKLLEALKKAREQTRPRPADEQERTVFYKMVPHEIAGRPVTVVGSGAHRLLLWSEGGKVVHLDAIGRYKDLADTSGEGDMELPPEE
ncbi:MAG: hypothetical protein P1V51_04120 [Deltaproteobacteria bacterium]|nr:hypothetical protein [Deltaproteobacteria bacterium]